MESKDVTICCFKCLYIDSVNDNTLGSSPSIMKFYLEENRFKIEIAFESSGTVANMKA